MNSTAESRVPFSVAQLERPLSPAITETGALPLSHPSLHDHRDVQTVDELRQNIDHAIVVAHNGRVNDQVQARIRRVQTVGSRPVSHGLHPRKLLKLRNRDIENLINGLQLVNLIGLQNWTERNGLCAMTGLSTTLTCTTRWACQ